MTKSALAVKVRREYEESAKGPFPLTDLLKLQSIDREKWSYLHGLLDLYFGSIAGYASRADQLWRKSREQVLEAQRDLLLPFFEKYPFLAVYRDAIAQESTPALFTRLAIVEKRRKQLLIVIDEILRSPTG